MYAYWRGVLCLKLITNFHRCGVNTVGIEIGNAAVNHILQRGLHNFAIHLTSVNNHGHRLIKVNKLLV